MPSNPRDMGVLARTRVAALEAFIVERKERLTKYESQKLSAPEDYHAEREDVVKKELERSEGALIIWRGLAAKAERGIPVYNALIERTDAFLSGDEKALEEAAGGFRQKVGQEQSTLTDLFREYLTQGWTPPPALKALEGKDLLLRALVNYLGVHLPAGTPYTYVVDEPGQPPHYDI